MAINIWYSAQNLAEYVAFGQITVVSVIKIIFSDSFDTAVTMVSLNFWNSGSYFQKIGFFFAKVDPSFKNKN